MNIRIIRHNDNMLEALIRGRNILEITAKDRKMREYDLTLFDPETNTIKEIAPEIQKINSIPVFNCIWNSEDVYFAALDMSDASGNGICIFKYENAQNACKCILKIDAESIDSSKNSSLKIFVLSENYVIAQSEHKKDNNIESLMGNIEFVQTLYNVDTEESVVISDLNLINNGINMIQPVSETHMMLKTGFSYLEDSRINKDNEKEALIESVYFSSNSMFLSSILRDNITAGYKLLGTAYFDKCIISPKVSGEYVFFTIVDREKMSSETVFYNYVTDETIRCVSQDVLKNDLSNAYIINNTPYIRNTYSDRTEFFNVRTSESDCVFFDEDFVSVVGDLFIFSETRGKKEYLRIYRSPKLDLVAEERAEFLCGVSDMEDYYLYVK